MPVCGNDVSVLHHAYFVRIHDRLQAVRDDKNRLALDNFADPSIHFLLVFGINESSRFIEHNDGRIFQNRSRKMDKI
ncbi:MAG: hypothetical protein K6E36_11705 [Oscillospiraceae bacterium]|nr:hypothetical protein [Oscillospiraceae bacterium]